MCLSELICWKWDSSEIRRVLQNCRGLSNISRAQWAWVSLRSSTHCSAACAEPVVLHVGSCLRCWWCPQGFVGWTGPGEQVLFWGRQGTVLWLVLAFGDLYRQHKHFDMFFLTRGQHVFMNLSTVNINKNFTKNQQSSLKRYPPRSYSSEVIHWEGDANHIVGVSHFNRVSNACTI